MKKVKENNSGFTLVELIVVLVILAILAAILVPALLGYVDRAKGQQIVLNARTSLMAAQAEFTEMYAKDKTFGTSGGTGGIIALGESEEGERILKTADVPDCTYFEVGTSANMTSNKHDGFKITYAYYQEGSKSVYFDGTSWEVTDLDANEARNIVNPSVVYYITSFDESGDLYG